MPRNRKIRLSYLIFCIMIFSIGFLAFTFQQMPNYFQKDLRSYDECTNAVASNNLYYDIFPPRLRLNSLYPDYQNWKEGPDWQHIPPMFLYAPLPFYMMDGGPTIEVRRLSYVLFAYLTGIFFIIGISLLFKGEKGCFRGIHSGVVMAANTFRTDGFKCQRLWLFRYSFSVLSGNQLITNCRFK
jgi:hypothetical protein